MANYRVIGTDGREYGPVSPEELRNWIGAGRVNATTLVCIEGSMDWRALGELPEFRPFVAGGRLPGAVRAPVYPGYRQTNTWAIWGFICGLLSLTLCSCCCIPLDLLGIVFSVIGLVQINNHPSTQSGTAFAIMGLVLSLLSILMGVAFSILWFSSGAAEEFMHDLEREFRFGAGRLLRV